ncbi:MAG TPA: SRPBCC domain-containing protein [Candidatus Binataceae bacterium]|nr:SRPBCC domain-containing protein [Candidatus Binataceae bacterium]
MNGRTSYRLQSDHLRGPNGNKFPNPRVYLTVVKNERLVYTHAYTRAWGPMGKPFMTVILTFEEHAGSTKYTARVRHWTVADREATEQLAALVEKR